MAINFGKAFAPNPVAELASAVGGAVAQAPYQNAQLQAIGQQVLEPYMRQAQSDPYNPALIAKIRQIAQQYHLPPPIAGSPGGSWDSAPAAPAPSDPASPPTGAASSAQTPTGTSTSSPAAPSGITMAKPAAPAAGAQTWQDPSLQPKAQAYSALLHEAATNPSLLRDQGFHAKLIHAAAAVGRGPEEVKGDIAAYQQKVKAGIQPGGGHPAAAPQAGANAATTPAQAPSTTANAAPTPTQPGPESQPGVAAAQPAAPSGSYFRPANEGPLRVDINSWLGPLSSQDFAALSGMAPEQRIAFLRQQGRDLNGFDQTWLHSNPSLSPLEQGQMAEHVGTLLAKDISTGATPDQIKLTLASYRPYLSPAQNAEIDANITDELDGQLRIRQTQVEQTGFLRQQTLQLMNRKFDATQQNVAWDHNYKYTVLNDKNAQWSAQQATRQQNANTASSRLTEEISRDQANGLIDAQGRPIKGGQGGVKPGELINTANKMLDSIRSGVNEYNTRIQNAIQNPGRSGVNAPMEADLQNQIDAYNNLVDMMDARGMHYFKHYTGPDQSAIHANTAAVQAANAVGAQGQSTPGPAAHAIPAGAQAGTFKNGRHGYSLNGKYYYDDGTPANP